MNTFSELLQGLFGLITLVLLVGGLVYMIIHVVRGKKYIYRQAVNMKSLEAAKEGDQYIFKRSIYKDLVFPIVWIISFSTVLLSSADLSTAWIGIPLLTWFMFFRVYFILRSRKDQVVIHENEVEFHFRKDAVKVNLKDYKEINLEFRKTSGYNGSLVTPLLILSGDTRHETTLSNAAFAKAPYEVTEAIMILNSYLKAKKTWNDTIRKRMESLPLRA